MRVLLVGISTDDLEVNAAITGATVVHVASADELLESIQLCAPDIVLIDGSLPEIERILMRMSALLPVPVIMLLPSDMLFSSEQVTASDLYGCIRRPLDAGCLRQSICIALAQFARLEAARGDAEQLREAFAARKIIDRAKGMLMQRQHLSEEAAYTHLREESRRQRVPIVDIAKALLSDVEDSPAKRGTFPTPPSASLRRIPSRGSRS